MIILKRFIATINGNILSYSFPINRCLGIIIKRFAPTGTGFFVYSAVEYLITVGTYLHIYIGEIT